MTAPSVLLVDEPTANVDRRQAASIVELLARTTHDHGCATVMVSHDSEALQACHRITALHDLQDTGDERAPVAVHR